MKIFSLVCLLFLYSCNMPDGCRRGYIISESPLETPTSPQETNPPNVCGNCH